MPPHDHEPPLSQGAAALSPEALLEHLDWVQRLAVRLTRDESRAEDLVQRTFLRALKRPPHADHTAPRAWLARVLRNEASMDRRSEGRRREREERVARARDVAAPSALEVEQRFELQRQLVAAVDQLDEPYRITVVLRYFEDLPPREIAERLQLPVKTVETRLARARSKLRQSLDRQHTSRAAWTAIVVPSLRGGAPAAAPLAAGALVMTLKLITGAAAVSLLLVLGLQMNTRPPLDPADTEVVPERSVVDAHVSEQEAALPAGPSTRTASMETLTRPATTPIGDAVAPMVFSGIVLGSDGLPLSGIALRLDPAPLAAEPFASRSDGRFDVELPPGAIAADAAPAGGLPGTVHIVAAAPAWTTLLAARIDIPRLVAVTDLVVAVAPSSERHGRAVTADGSPVEGAVLELALPTAFRTRFDALLMDTLDQTWMARSASDGTFVVSAMPLLAGCRLTGRADGHVDVQIDDIPVGDEELLVVFERLDATRRIDGIVVDAQGHPVEGARVGLGLALRTTDEAGLFSFQLDAEDGVQRGPRRLIAVARGFCPVTFEATTDGHDEADWPDFVELRFTREPATICGHVFDEAGDPLPGARVWAANVTIIGAHASGMALVAEPMLRSDGLFWHSVETDANGRFVLEGLLDRSYDLRALMHGTVRMTRAVAVAGDTQDAELRFEHEELIDSLRGRVVDRQGNPIRGAYVHVSREALRANTGSNMLLENARSPTVRTGADGRFELDQVPLQGDVTLNVFATGFTRRWTVISELDLGPEVLDVVLSRDCRVRVVIDDLALGIDTVSFVDEAGAKLLFHRHGSAIVEFMQFAEVIEGRTQTLVVPDSAVAAEFRAGTEHVATVRITLVGDDVTIVSP